MAPLIAMPNLPGGAGDSYALKLGRNGEHGGVSNLSSAIETSENQLLSGAQAAYSDAPISVASNLARKRRGGARNRADRQSEDMTATQVGNLIAARRHAVAIGLPFTRMITIHWEEAGIALEEMVRATGSFIDLLTKALKRWGSKTAWLYVHEGGAAEGRPLSYARACPGCARCRRVAGTETLASQHHRNTISEECDP